MGICSLLMSVIRVEFSNRIICMLLMMSILCDVLCFVDAATNGFKISPYNNTISSDNSEWPSDITSQNPILTESAAELMEVFREKSNHEGVVSVYEAMKTRGVTPGARVGYDYSLHVATGIHTIFYISYYHVEYYLM